MHLCIYSSRDRANICRVSNAVFCAAATAATAVTYARVCVCVCIDASVNRSEARAVKSQRENCIYSLI